VSVLAARAIALGVMITGAAEALIAETGATGTLLSVALVAIGPALWRGRSRARIVALTLLVTAPLLPSGDALGGFVPLRLALAGVLLFAWRAFPASGDPATRRAALLGVALAASALVADFADAQRWISHPVLATVALTSALLIARAVGPWRTVPVATAEDRRRAARVLARHGRDTLAPFALRSDKAYHFAAAGDAFLAYRVVAGVALVSGDPIGPPERSDELLTGFLLHARRHGWTVAGIGISADGLALWRRKGFAGHYTGEEAIVEPARFTLDGRSIRKVRQSVSRLSGRRYTTRILRADAIEPEVAERLERIAAQWRGTRRETGFSMAFETTAVCRDRPDIYAIACDGEGIVRGFLQFGAVGGGRVLSLAAMRRERDTPNGLNEFMICALLAWARAEGVERVSLNFAAFAAVLDPPGPVDRVTAIERRALQGLGGRFQLERLLSFNRKFATGWTPRYAAYPGVAALPRVAVAAMLAEAYVARPHLRLRRRR
jgi:lysyl-tRNA synthetase class 2